MNASAHRQRLIEVVAMVLILPAGVACSAPATGSTTPAPTPTTSSAPPAPPPTAPPPPPVPAPTAPPAPTQPSPAASAAIRAEGEAIYLQSCAGCHVAEGTGNPGVYPPLAGAEWVTGPKGRLVRILLHGATGPLMVAGEQYQGLMPGWGSALTDAQIAAVSTYVRSAWGNSASAVTTAEVAAIRTAEAGRTAFWTAPELMRITAP